VGTAGIQEKKIDRKDKKETFQSAEIAARNKRRF